LDAGAAETCAQPAVCMRARAHVCVRVVSCLFLRVLC
jgi:hypothetical protein